MKCAGTCVLNTFSGPSLKRHIYPEIYTFKVMTSSAQSNSVLGPDIELKYQSPKGLDVIHGSLLF